MINPQQEIILVTGGSGLLGGELIETLLADGKRVRAIYHTTPIHLPKNNNLELFRSGLLDTVSLEEAMEGVSKVYHCAGMVSFNPKKVDELFAVNIQGTANVVNAALEAGVKKLLYVSSIAALGRIREGVLVNESMNWSEETSNSNYGKSKYFAELEVWRGIAEGLPAVIVNPSLILGAGDWNKGSSGIFKSAYNEFPWYSEGISGFVYVKDVVNAMILLMESEILAERFILNATNSPYREVFNLMAKAFDKKAPTRRVTPLLASLVWRWEALKGFLTGKEPLLTKETAKTAQAKVYFDNSKFLKAFPDFAYTPLEQAINESAKKLQKIHVPGIT